jgi:predicted nucleic acid-binding protein
MKIVADASAILAVLLDEKLRSKIVQITYGFEVISPPSLPWEVGNALSANVRRGRLTHAEANRAIKDFMVMDIRLTDIDLVEAMGISNQFGIFAYDAYVLDCAKMNKTPILSLDHAMVGIAREMGISVIDLE